MPTRASLPAAADVHIDSASVNTAGAGRGGLYWKRVHRTAFIGIGALALGVLHKISQAAGGASAPRGSFRFVQTILLAVFVIAGCRGIPLLFRGDGQGARYMSITTLLAFATAAFPRFIRGTDVLRPAMVSMAFTGLGMGMLFIGLVGVQSWRGGRILVYGYWVSWVSGIGGLILICFGHGAEVSGAWIGNQTSPAWADAGRAFWLLASLVTITALRHFRLSTRDARNWVGNLDVKVRTEVSRGDIRRWGLKPMLWTNRLMGWCRQRIDLLVAVAYLAWSAQLLAQPDVRATASWLPVGLILNALALPLEHLSELMWNRARRSAKNSPAHDASR